jgi:hypothetical protein
LKYFIVLFLITNAIAASDPLISVSIHYGEKSTQIEVKKVKAKFIASISSAGESRTRELSKKDVDYLLSKLQGEKARREGICPRQEIEARVTEKKKTSELSACLGSGTELSKKLQGIADLLLTAI